jgi:hypothetical protein
MDELKKNQMDEQELDKASGGRTRHGIRRPRPSSGLHDGNANSMAANVDKTQNASGWLGSSMIGK